MSSENYADSRWKHWYSRLDSVIAAEGITTFEEVDALYQDIL